MLSGATHDPTDDVNDRDEKEPATDSSLGGIPRGPAGGKA